MRAIRSDVRLSELVAPPDARIVVITDSHYKAGWLVNKFSAVGVAKMPARTVDIENGAKMRFLVVNPFSDADMYVTAGLTATHIFFDDFAGYSEWQLNRWKYALRDRYWSLDFVLAPFCFEELE